VLNSDSSNSKERSCSSVIVNIKVHKVPGAKDSMNEQLCNWAAVTLDSDTTRKRRPKAFHGHSEIAHCCTLIVNIRKSCKQQCGLNDFVHSLGF